MRAVFLNHRAIQTTKNPPQNKQICQEDVGLSLLKNRGRLLLWTPGPVPFGTCICSNVETILS